ncbi:MAG: energy transducer TonB [Bacteroidota bacterium]|jgi:protein TonB
MHPSYGAGRWLSQPPRLTPAMQFAILASILVHAAVLSLRFAFPDASRLRSPPQTLDVILVNSKSATRPAEPQALAQSNLDGGGNTDEDRRAKTPLPATREVARGDDVKRARQKVRDLEAKQRQLLAQAQKAAPPVASEPAKPEPAPEPAKPLSGADLVNSALALARLEAQIARQVEEYNKRPRKTFVGARAAESRFAQYVEDWRLKIERIGNLNYPDGARGRIYGSLRLTISIKPDGSVDDVQIDRPADYRILNDAALKIIRLAAPFAPFPPEIRKDTDLLVITRTWTFAPGDRLFDN